MSQPEDLSRKQEIEGFLNLHKSKPQLHEVSVKDMRHIIPLFFMETYIEQFGQYTKKVKGLWERRPSDWPANVPFVDPNNKLKNEGEKACKPKKELLGQMLNHLIKRYEKVQNNGPALDLGAVIPLLSDPDLPMLDLIESNDPLFGQDVDNSVDRNQLMLEHYSSASGSYNSQSMQPSVSFDLDFREGFDEFADSKLFESIQDQEEEPIRPHEQAMDNDDCNLGENWNPLAQLLRIQQKLGFLGKQKSTKGTDLELMVAHYKKLKEKAKASANWLSLIDDLHALERDIDIMKFSNRMLSGRFSEISSKKSTTDLLKLDHLENETPNIYMVADDPCNEVQIAVEDPELMTSLNIEPRSGGPQDSGSINNLSLRFVSGPAPEVLNTSAPKVSALSENCYGGSRQAEFEQFHYVSQPSPEDQDVGFSMSTSLSENCKPVQAAEDDVQECHQNPPLQDLVDLQLLRENTNFPTIDEVLSFLNISSGSVVEPSTGTLAPVQETSAINLAYLDVGQVNAIGGGAGTVPPLMLSSDNSLGVVESGSAAPVASVEATKNVTIPVEVYHFLLDQASRAFVQPAPVSPEQKSISTGFQPQMADIRRRDVKPGGKRSHILLEDEEMEVTASSLQPSPESSCSNLIPTMVEEFGNSDALLRYPKKSKRMS